MALTQCPVCDKPVKPGSTECVCGLVLAKWEAKMAASAGQPAAATAAKSSRSGELGWFAVLLVAVVMFFVIKYLDKAQEQQAGQQMAKVVRGASARGRKLDKELAGKSTEELLRMLKNDALKNPPFYELLRRDAKAEAAAVVQAMLRDKSRAVGGEPPPQLKVFLQQLGAPVLRDYFTTGVYPRLADKGFRLVEWEIEARGGALHASVVLFVGADVAAGFRRAPSEEPSAFPILAKYELRVQGGALAAPVVREVEIPRQDGLARWKGMTLVPELGSGEYAVNLSLHVQYIDEAGERKTLSETRPPLRVLLR